MSNSVLVLLLVCAAVLIFVATCTAPSQDIKPVPTVAAPAQQGDRDGQKNCYVARIYLNPDGTPKGPAKGEEVPCSTFTRTPPR